MSNPNQEQFKELTGLDFSELEELRLRGGLGIQDGMKHFYHPPTDRIYSWITFEPTRWVNGRYELYRMMVNERRPGIQTILED